MEDVEVEVLVLAAPDPFFRSFNMATVVCRTFGGKSGRTRSEKFADGFEPEVLFEVVGVDSGDEIMSKASFRKLLRLPDERSLWLEEESSTTKEFFKDILFVVEC